MKEKKLHLLIVEDSEDDALLLVRELQQGGYNLEYERVETARGMEVALTNHSWDLIICDYSLPSFNAPEALKVLKSTDKDIPFIIVSGTVGEETAVAALKAGAHDFLIKGNWARLLPAIDRELREARVRLERKRAQISLQESEAKFRRLVEYLPGVVYMNPASEASTTIYISPQIETMMGYSPEEWLAKTDFWKERILLEDQQEVLAQIDVSVQTGEPFDMEYRMFHRDGHVVWVRDQSVLVRDEENRPQFWQGIMLDITEKKQAEAALWETERRLWTIVNSAPITVFATDSDGVFTLNEGKGLARAGMKPGENVGKSAYKLFGGLPVKESNGDLTEGKDVIRRVLEGETILGTTEVNGVIFENQFSPFLDKSNHIDGLVGVAMDVTELKQHEQELEAIAAMADILRVPKTLDEILDHLLDEALRLISAEAGSIWLYDAATDSVNMKANRGWNESNVSSYKIGESVPGMGMKSGQEFVSREFQSDLRIEESIRARIPEGLGGACIPLHAADKVVGVMFVNVTLPRELTPLELRILSTLASMGGNTINRMDLHEQTVKQLERLEALREIDLTISNSLDLRLTLQTLLEQLVNQLGVDAADVMLVKNKFGSLECIASRGFRRPMIQTSSLRFGEGLAGKAASTRDVVRVDDLRQSKEKFLRQNILMEEEFISYFAVPLIAKGDVKGVLEIFHRSLINPSLDWLNFLDSLSWQTAIAIDNALLFEDLQRSNMNLLLAYDRTIEGWSRALDLRDKETEGHTERVTEVTILLAKRMDIPDSQLVHIWRGAMLHDIGKLGVPDSILLKPGELTDEEWVLMRKHPQLAYEMLKPIAYLNEALNIPHYHHEKWDGSGYPNGLKGKMIPLEARIFAVVDVWDALSCDRPYRTAWPREKVLNYIKEQSGIHFDPEIVDIFLEFESQWQGEDH